MWKAIRGRRESEAQPIVPADRLRRPLNSNYKGIPIGQAKRIPCESPKRSADSFSESICQQVGQHHRENKGADCKTTTGL
jgi:hypothetical protein